MFSYTGFRVRNENKEIKTITSVSWFPSDFDLLDSIEEVLINIKSEK